MRNLLQAMGQNWRHNLQRRHPFSIFITLASLSLSLFGMCRHLDTANRISDSDPRPAKTVNGDIIGQPRVLPDLHSSTAESVSESRTVTVTGDEDGVVYLWDDSSDRSIAVLKGHSEKILSANFNGDGTRLVTTSTDNTARLWDLNHNELIAVFQGHVSWVLSAAFSPDEKQIVTASSDCTARVWDASSGELVAILQDHSHWLLSAKFSDNTTQVSATLLDGSERTWSLENSERWQAEVEPQSRCKILDPSLD